MQIDQVWHLMRVSVIHDVWLIPTSALVLFVLVGCTGPGPKTNGIPNAKTYLEYSVKATERGDWVAAYRLMEEALITEDTALRKEAESLLDKYPRIRDAAYETFSKESLENTYKTHGEQAWLIEEERISIYEITLATPEQASQARHNYQEVYGDLIKHAQTEKNIRLDANTEKHRSDKAFEQEIQYALVSGEVDRMGNIRNLLKGIEVGQTLRKHALARFGRPHRTFEAHTILTWPVRVEGDKYSILEEFVRNLGGVTHSLVMAFDKSLVLSDMAMVRVVK